MKILPLLALAAACVLPCFAQTYRVQMSGEYGAHAITADMSKPMEYSTLKAPELTGDFLASKRREDYATAIKADPQQTGLQLKILIEPCEKDLGKLTVTIDYLKRTLSGFGERDGKWVVYYLTDQWHTHMEITPGENTLVYSLEKTQRVTDITPFWGEIPLLGRFFQKPGTSRSIHREFVLISLIPEKKS